MKFILGKKLSMTQIWRNDFVVPVTCIQVEPCVITQVKTAQRDGYRAVQLATGRRQVKNIAKPQRGHFGQWGNFQYLREFNLDQESSKSEEGWQAGQQVSLKSFVPGDRVQVTSTSKGKGFQGGVKRHGFHGQGRTHGVKDQQRMPGSVGATGPAHIFKGTRMAGRMGGGQVTVKNLEVVEIDEIKGYIYLRGAVPGWRNGWVAIAGSGEVIIDQPVSSKEDNQVEEKDQPEVEVAEVTEPIVDQLIETDDVPVESNEPEPEQSTEDQETTLKVS